MIKKESRIPKKYFPQVLKGSSLHGEFFRVTLSSPISDFSPNCAVILSKKHIKKANQRNLVKRLIYKVISDNFTILPKKTLVFSVVKSISLGKTKEERKEFQNLIIKDISLLIYQISKKYEKNS